MPTPYKGIGNRSRNSRGESVFNLTDPNYVKTLSKDQLEAYKAFLEPHKRQADNASWYSLGLNWIGDSQSLSDRMNRGPASIIEPGMSTDKEIQTAYYNLHTALEDLNNNPTISSVSSSNPVIPNVTTSNIVPNNTNVVYTKKTLPNSARTQAVQTVTTPSTGRGGVRVPTKRPVVRNPNKITSTAKPVVAPAPAITDALRADMARLHNKAISGNTNPIPVGYAPWDSLGGKVPTPNMNISTIGKVIPSASSLPITYNSKTWEGTIGKTVIPGLKTYTSTGSTGGTDSGKFNLGSVLSTLKDNAGDILSTVGATLAAKQGEALTREHFSKVKPNINPYKEFGKSALGEYDKTAEYIQRSGERQKAELLRQQALANDQVQKNSMSSAVQNALQQANYANTLQGQAAINANIDQQNAQWHNQRANLLNQIDQLVMQGEYQRDLADRQDLANFYSNLSQNKMDYAKGLQHLGGMLNHSRQNDTKLNLIRQLSQYGFTVDSNGNLVKV